MSFKTEDMTLTDLCLAVTDYIMDSKEEEDFHNNPSEVHIYKMAMVLRYKILGFEMEFSQTCWEQLYHEDFKGRQSNDEN